MAHPAQMAQYHYQKFYGCEVSFNQGCYAYVMSAADSLALKSGFADPSLTQLLLKQAEVEQLPSSLVMKAYYNRFIAPWLILLKAHAEAPKIEQIAK